MGTNNLLTNVALKADLRELEHHFDAKLEWLENRITTTMIKWIVGLLLAQTALMITVVIELV